MFVFQKMAPRSWRKLSRVVRLAEIVQPLYWSTYIWLTCVQSLHWENSPGEGNSNPLQYSGLEKSMDRGSWQATVHGVTESDRTEWLSFSHRFEKDKESNFERKRRRSSSLIFNKNCLLVFICNCLYTMQGEFSLQWPEGVAREMWYHGEQQ